MHKWSMGKKLGINTGALAACVVALSLVSLWGVSTLQDSLNRLGGPILRKSELAGSMQEATSLVRAEVRAVVLAVALKKPQDVQKPRDGGLQALARLEGYVNEIRPMLADPRAKAANEGMATILPQWKAAFEEIAQLASAGKAEAASKIRTEKEAPLAQDMAKFASQLSAVQVEVAKAQLNAADERVTSIRWTILGFILLGVVMAALTFWLVRNLVATLRGAVTELNAGGEQTASASAQIAGVSQTLSQGASEQAASLEEVSASMEEMTAMARRNGDSSAEATAMMSETAKQVERSNVALSEMVASMSAIKSSSEKVAKINKTIDEIAFQTNILALNAAVEAARAGEAGMGFAVVADEVRNLAQRSAVAAKDTAALIEESITNSSEGALRLEQVSTAIRGITESATKVKSLLDEVNESSKQQGQGITQVSTAIQQVSTVTQTSAASAEESAAAAEELRGQSQNVRELVNMLAVMVEGASAEKQTRPVSQEKARVPASGGSVKKTLGKHASAKHDEDPFPMESAEAGSFRSF